MKQLQLVVRVSADDLIMGTQEVLQLVGFAGDVIIEHHYELITRWITGAITGPATHRIQSQSAIVDEGQQHGDAG
jgi:hypothetical protein